MAGTAATLGIRHVFVLMLENRSFDHMLGFSGIKGTDPVTGQPTAIDGLTGQESNTAAGHTFTVTQGADLSMPTDPNHEFNDVLEQLSGPGATYSKGGAYPAINNGGYVASYLAGGGKDGAEIMKCYSPAQLPVLEALAHEFVVCDNWHASMPGPTWPNRMFVHAASSGGLDHSPSTLEIAEWETVDGFHFPNGTIFDRLQQAGITRRLYAGDNFPMVSALKRITLSDIRRYSLFAADVAAANYPYSYIFIEPSYDVLNDYRNGTSQHPLGNVTRGEALIKQTYEAIRNSPQWDSSVLIITWDEHGGFYDHAVPPPAVNPGDTPVNARYNKNGFTFERYGPRVPAVVISPRIPRNLVDHRLYDHSSIPATIESLFGVAPLTARDRSANRLDALITLATPRDTPARLPQPMTIVGMPAMAMLATPVHPVAVSRPHDDVNGGNLPSVVHAAMRQDLEAQRRATVRTVEAIKSRADALAYIEEVQKRVAALEPPPNDQSPAPADPRATTAGGSAQ